MLTRSFRGLHVINPSFRKFVFSVLFVLPTYLVLFSFSFLCPFALGEGGVLALCPTLRGSHKQLLMIIFTNDSMFLVPPLRCPRRLTRS